MFGKIHKVSYMAVVTICALIIFNLFSPNVLLSRAYASGPTTFHVLDDTTNGYVDKTVGLPVGKLGLLYYTDNLDIWYKVVNSDGTQVFNVNLNKNGNSPNYYRFYPFERNGGDTILVFVEDTNSGNSYGELKYLIVDKNGHVGSETTLDTSIYMTYPSAATRLSNGGLAVYWFNNSGNGVNNFSLRFYDGNIQPVKTLTFSGVTSYFDKIVSVTASNNGRLMLIRVNNIASVKTYYAELYDNSGNKIKDIISGTYLQAAALSNGNFAILSGDPSTQLSMSLYDSAGNSLGNPVGLGGPFGPDSGSYSWPDPMLLSKMDGGTVVFDFNSNTNMGRAKEFKNDGTLAKDWYNVDTNPSTMYGYTPYTGYEGGFGVYNDITGNMVVYPAEAVNSVVVTPSSESVVQGGTEQLSATVSAVGGAAETVTWASSNVKVTVNATGLVTVAADAVPGNYTITATSTFDTSKKGTATITVTAAPVVNSVVVSPSSESMVQGGTAQLTATVSVAGGAAQTVTWTSSDAKVSVNATGLVTVAADAVPGNYTITATSSADGSKKGTAMITVTAAPAVNSVVVSPSSESVVQGETAQLNAMVSAVGGAAETVTWTSSDAMVTVNATGLVTVAADAVPGDYTITATSTVDGSKKGTATITVTAAPAVNSVVVSPSSASVVQGGTAQLNTMVSAVGGAAQTVTWTSSDAMVTVNATGLVTVAADAAPSDYTITATSTFDTSKKGTATITVTAAPAVNSVVVSPSSASVVQGGTAQLNEMVSAVGGAAQTVTWTSSDVKVSVNATGLVTVAADAAPGDYTITATSTFDTSKKGTTTITVTAIPLKPSIVTQPSNQTVIVGKTVTFTVGATGTGTLSYQWIKGSQSLSDGGNISGAATATLTITNAQAADSGTYSVVVSNSEGPTSSHAANLSVEAPGSLVLKAIPGNSHAELSWSPIEDAAFYGLYQDDLQIETVTGSVYGYDVLNLTNGITYRYEVKAMDSNHVILAASNKVSTTPTTVSTAPTNVTAVAGDRQATVTFTTPTDNGGSAITGYEVIASPGNIKATGTAGPITVTGLTNGTSYTFTVKAINGAGSSASSAVSNTVSPSSPSGSGSGTPTVSTEPQTTNTELDILVNGKAESAGTATTTTVNGQTVTSIDVDQKKLEDKLAAEGQHAVVTISVNTQSDVVVAELNGQMVKNMEDKQAVVEIKTDSATYTLPAEQINIDMLSEQIGKSMALPDIKVQIEIAEPSADTIKVVENAADKGMFTLVVPPINFTVKASYGDKTIEITQFNAYVERTIAIPDGVDPNKTTTGVVVDPDGTVRHVPTRVVQINGKYYAKINSLTNSTYSVIWHPLDFKDMSGHWSKNAVNDMGSRLVISGSGDGIFSPDRDITRAEFAAIIIRGLGLKLLNGAAPFSDVKATDWYASAINTAYAYHLINGFDDGTFRPSEPITREQAMSMIEKAMKLTGLKEKLESKAPETLLVRFVDASAVSGWAMNSIAECLEAGIVSGRSDTVLAPKTHITRAETAVMVQKLLQISGLI